MLSRLSLENAELIGHIIAHADLSGTNFDRADLSGCTFINTNLAGASFNSANLHFVKLMGPNRLEGADFSNAMLSDSNLIDDSNKRSRRVPLTPKALRRLTKSPPANAMSHPADFVRF